MWHRTGSLERVKETSGSSRARILWFWGKIKRVCSACPNAKILVEHNRLNTCKQYIFTKEVHIDDTRKFQRVTDYQLHQTDWSWGWFAHTFTAKVRLKRPKRQLCAWSRRLNECTWRDDLYKKGCSLVSQHSGNCVFSTFTWWTSHFLT